MIMKKQYIMPVTQVMEIRVENALLTASLQVSSEEKTFSEGTATNDVKANFNVWNDDWSNGGE